MKLAVFALLAAFARAKELTSATWDQETTGKTVFVKFLAPWCGHCKSMKPAWDKLIDEFKDSKTALVADVDCTADGKSLCEKKGVSGYPTIKYGDPSDLQDYQGGRDFDALKKFADENLGPTCGPDNLDLCDNDGKAQIKKFMKWDIDELEMSIEEGDEKIKNVETKYKKIVGKLEKEIQDLQGTIAKENSKKDSAIAKESKKLGLKFMKAVAAARNKKDPDLDPDPDHDPDLDEPKEEL